MNKAEFIINDEDHTLGNLLQDEMLKCSDVKFAAYIIEHPSERKIKFKIEVKENLEAKIIFNGVIKNIIKNLKLLKI